MNYLVTVLRDRISAEAAYTALEKEGLSKDQVTILGKGYKGIDELGLTDPFLDARKRAIFMAYWLVPFGFIAGFLFSFITDLQTFSWAGIWGDRLIGAILGAASGAFGSFAINDGFSFVFKRNETLPYGDRLEAGKYILVVRASNVMTRQVTRILRKFDPETTQVYDPDDE